LQQKHATEKLCVKIFGTACFNHMKFYTETHQSTYILNYMFCYYFSSTLEVFLDSLIITKLSKYLVHFRLHLLSLSFFHSRWNWHYYFLCQDSWNEGPEIPVFKVIFQNMYKSGTSAFWGYSCSY